MERELISPEQNERFNQIQREEMITLLPGRLRSLEIRLKRCEKALFVEKEAPCEPHRQNHHPGLNEISLALFGIERQCAADGG